MRFANTNPLMLRQGSENTRVLALFGMPNFQTVEPGKFSNFKFATSEMGLTQAYISPALARKPQASGPTNTDLAAISVNALSTTGLGTGAVGAAGAALMIAGTDTSPDPRITYGAAICYRPASEQADFKKAYVECVDQVVEDVKSALGPKVNVVENSQLFNISGTVDVPSYGKQPVTLLVGRVYNHAAEGYAPIDKGAFKANIFSIQIKRFGDFSASKATIDDIGQALRRAKRLTIAYRLNASEDYRKLKDSEPVGIY
ncbi:MULTISPECIES: hypothetical protein [Pseudomonas]|uniref:hypothetical protein n=1 Tax=Pseudomonas TaxID=286 RepID=UPI0023605774|nr:MULTISPECIES: hypothetical protein [Pseudomonas]WJV23191.1 hypothetical protein PSR66_26725 [Pseudomonas chlororaphis]